MTLFQKPPLRRLRTLESRFYLLFTLLFFATILTMQIISTRFIISTVRNATIENNRLLLDELTQQIDSYISGMDRISQNLVSDKDILTFLESPAPNTEVSRLLQNRFASILEGRDDMSDIVLFCQDGNAVSGRGIAPEEFSDYRSSFWYREALSSPGKTVLSTAYVQNLVPGRYSWVVSQSTVILKDQDSIPLGVLLVDIKFNRIKELYDSLVVGEKGYNFILDSRGDYIFHPSQQLVFSALKNEPLTALRPILRSEATLYRGNGRNYITARSTRTGWYVVSVSFNSDLATGWPYIQLGNALIGLVLFTIVGIITSLITRSVTRPLYHLQTIMRSAETGEFQPAGTMEGTEEIQELAREYDLMVGRIGELMKANVREQELKRKSDLKALQAQINPHFLYNTLDSIIWMAEMKQPEEVVKMTSALSRLFRISISKGQDYIPLWKEVEHVRSYLTIQEMRYKNKFRYVIAIPENLHHCTVLKITLQPLVENAIYHGIRSVDYEGLIEITGKREGRDILLSITDNGTGMSSEELCSHLSGPYSSGTGVRNVHERIRLYFGARYGLECRDTPSRGTCISIRMPYKEKEPA